MKRLIISGAKYREKLKKIRDLEDEVAFLRDVHTRLQVNHFEMYKELKALREGKDDNR